MYKGHSEEYVSYDNKCRVCLNEGDILIYGDESLGDLIKPLIIFGGIDVQVDDDFPKYLCLDCHGQLQSAIIFRQTAQETERTLKNRIYTFDDEPIMLQLEDQSDTEEKYVDNVVVEDENTPYCRSCEVCFTTSSEYRQHMLSEEHANKKFDNTSNILAIKNNAYTSDDEPITQLEDQSDTEGRDDNNETVEDDNTPYHCKCCQLFFSTTKDYGEHILSEEHINRKFINASNFNNRTNADIPKKKKECPICHNEYAVGYLPEHIKTQHMKEELNIKCNICDKVFLTRKNFRLHVLRHKMKLPVQCTLCPYRGRSQKSLKTHMRRHTGEKPYKCPMCPLMFACPSNRRKHSRRHTAEYDYKCEICGKGFYTRTPMETHIKAIHMGIKDFECNICDSSFGSRKQLRNHQMKVHNKEKIQRVGRLPLYLEYENDS